MPSGMSMKARAERRARIMSMIRMCCIGLVLLVILFLAAWEFLSGGRASEILAGIRGPADLTERAAAVDSAVDAVLVGLGVADVRSSAEEESDGLHAWTHWEKSGEIPHGVGVFDCNATITRAVLEAGGSIVRVTESGPDWQGRLTLDMRFGVRDVETHHIVLKEATAQAAGRPVYEDGAPRIAIIIDDLGYSDGSAVRQFLRSDFPVTVSILPGTPYSDALADEAFRAGKEVLVHIPMEPESYPDTDPGDGALLLDQTYSQISSLTADAIDAVPHAVGANNHMGSAFTQDRGRMRAMMSVVSDKGFFYVDSMTTPLSKGFPEAERAGVRVARNNMFIDSPLDEQGRMDVRSQLSSLEEMARKRGYAVGIGHPHPETLRVLESEMPRMAERGVRFVLVSELARGAAH